MMEKLRQTLDHNRDKYLKSLIDIVAMDTHDIDHGIGGGLEKQAQEYMLELFRKMGATEVIKDQMTEEIIQKSIKLFGEGNPGHHYGGRFNVYARFAGENKDTRSIMFNGHMDTMPTDSDLWDTPPFNPTIKDGKLYGLGVCDMKAGLMASVMAVQLIKDANIPLPGDVIITSVVDEEGGGNGSIVAAINGQTADAVVVCEPTHEELITAHMGFIFFNVEIEGKSVHSGLKRQGISAIEKAVKLMGAIDELEHQWLMKYKHKLLPPPTSNIGIIEGGSAGSTVADYCVFKACVHYIPGQMSHEQIVREYSDVINRCCIGDEWLSKHLPKISIYQSGGSFEMDLEHDFVKIFGKAYEKVLGKKVGIIGSPAGCDSRIWKNIAGCPTLQYGPGALAQCHTVNEFVELEQYYNAVLLYAQLILEWCR